MRHVTAIAAVILAAALVSAAPRPPASVPPPAGDSPAGASFDKLVDRFFDDCWFPHHPTSATAAGFHQYDTSLEDFSRFAVNAQVSCLNSFRARFETLDPKPLGPGRAADRDLVLATIKAAILDLETVRMWRRNPDLYASTVAGGVFVIMSRNFAPTDDRVRSVIARERQVPRLLDAARSNLDNPPRVYTEVALQQLSGTIGFFRDDVPKAFEGVTDAELLSDFAKSNAGVIAALTDYQKFLQEKVLPRSKGDFRIGRDTFVKKLLYEEMVDLPLDRLRSVGYADLRRNQERLKQTAAAIDPKRTPEAILAELQSDHPAPDKLLDAFRDTLGGLRDFIAAKQILTLPSPVPPILQETPPFERALTSASMDTPGAYETVAKEAYFNVTLPEPSWSREQVEEHMAAFNRGTILSTAIHEAYPGHYTQFLWVQKAPSKVRKLLGSNTNGEGWAHYCEQMMLDEGYGDGDPKLRLGQIEDALLRNARYIVGIEMHTGKMTFEQGIDFFVKEGHQTRAIGEMETKRGASDPTYLYYTLGKLQILKLRDDYKTMRGDRFTLMEFHDRLLAMGYPPLKQVRREMLGNDSPTL